MTFDNELEEYSIIMLKPDCIDKRLQNVIINKVKSKNFKIIYKKDYTLNENEIRQNFLHPTDDYIKFLLNKPVEFYLVKGIDPHINLYYLKKAIRKEFKVEKITYNLIHSTDQGNEYHLFLAKFFNELDTIKFCNTIDYLVYFDKKCSLEDKMDIIKELDSKSSLKYICININNEEMVDFIQKRNNIDLKNIKISYFLEKKILFNNRDVTINLYFNIKNYDMNIIGKIQSMLDLFSFNDIKKYNNFFPVINKFQLFEEEINQYRYLINKNDDEKYYAIVNSKMYKDLKTLKGEGVKGITCFRPDFSLMQTELLMELSKMLELKKIGGSFGLSKLGHFSVSIDCFIDKIFKGAE